jgi:hypothetical protein
MERSILRKACFILANEAASNQSSTQPSISSNSTATPLSAAYPGQVPIRPAVQSSVSLNLTTVPRPAASTQLFFAHSATQISGPLDAVSSSCSTTPTRLQIPE